MDESDDSNDYQDEYQDLDNLIIKIKIIILKKRKNIC